MVSQDSYLQMKINHLIADTEADELTRSNLTDEEMLTVGRREKSRSEETNEKDVTICIQVE